MLTRFFRAQEFTVFISLAFLMIYFAFTTGDSWTSNLPSLLRDVSWLGIVALGQAIIIISGEFDLSVGSVYAFVSMVFVLLLRADFNPAIAFVFALALAALIGAINGYLTWKFQLPSLLVTLGALFFYRGLVEYVTGGQTMILPPTIQESVYIKFLGGKILGMSTSIYICVLLLAILTFAMTKTRYGNHVYAVGGDINAANATGVPCGSVKIRTFMICSTLAGFTGIITAASLNSVSTTTGSSMEFESIAATVIGGVSLFGGAGFVWGALIGVFTLLTLKHGLILDGVNIFTYQLLLGALLVGIVALKGILPGQFSKS